MDRERILKLLNSSSNLLDVYFFDQNKYLETHLKAPKLGLEQDAKYFWIFRNLDYEKWMERHGGAKILGLLGPSTEDLELAAFHVVQSLRSPDTASRESGVLYFFYNSTRNERGAWNIVGWRELLCVLNLLRQLIENRPTAATPLLPIFLRKALNFLSNDKLLELQTCGPTDVFKSLLCLSEPQNLWGALGQVLEDLEERGNLERLGKPNLTLVIDLSSIADSWEQLIGNIRKMTAGLPQGHYGAVRVLLSNLPEASSSCWLHRPSEVLLEYDRERKGMYFLQTQYSLTVVGFRFVA